MGSSISAQRSPFKRSDQVKAKLPITSSTDVLDSSSSPKSLSIGSSEELVSDMSGAKPPSKDKLLSGPPNPSSYSSKLSLTSSLKPKDPAKPTKVQLERWSSSFNALLSDPDGVKAFEVFLEESETEEGEFKKYLFFFRECNEFKQKLCELEKEATRIFETYLEVGSDLEIGTDKEGGKVGEKLEEVGFPQKHLFDASIQIVKNVLDNTHYVNFCLYLKEKYKL